MADIAKIGFEVDTSDLKKASGDLNEFSTAAKNASNSAQNVSKASQRIGAAAAGTSSLSRSFQTLATGENIAADKVGKYAIGMTKAVKVQNSMVLSVNRLNKALDMQAQKFTYLDTINKTTGVSGLSGKSALESYQAFKSGAVARDERPNKFNTANIAAQFQDIGVTAAMGMNPMTIALQQGTQLAAILNTMKNPLAGLKDAFMSVVNPVSLIAIGITALIASLIQIVDWSKVWDSVSKGLATALDWLADHIDVLTVALGAFIAVQVVTHFSSITSAIGNAVSAVVTLIPQLYKMAVAWIASLGPIAWITAGITAAITAIYAFKDEIANVIGEDVLNSVKSGINTFIGFHVGAFKIIGAGVEWLKDKLASLLPGGKSNINQGLFEYMGNTFKQSLNTDYLGKAADVASGVIDSVKGGLHKAADALRSSTAEADKAAKDAWDKLVKGVESRKIELTQEADLVGRIGADYEYTKTKYDLLNQAREAGITLTAQQTEYIEQQSIALGQQAYEVTKLKDRFDFAKSTTTSFFKDMKSGLMEGKTAWESFGDAITNVLNRIIDKMTEIGVDYLFGAMKGAGWFGASQTYAAPIGPTQTAGASGFFGLQALGGVWNHGIQTFATGGVVGSPTYFGTASGLGVMGEAGPEAIMPLERGPNGSLGVRASGMGGSNVVVNVVNNANANASVNQRETSQGTEIDVIIDQIVADKLATPGTAANSSMNSWNMRTLIAR